MTVHVTRLPIQLLPDPRRVITRLFVPGEENRIRDIIERLLAIPEAEVEALAGQPRSHFRPIHPDIDEVFLEHFEIGQASYSERGSSQRRAATAHRRLLHDGIRDRVGRSVQSLDGAGD